MAVDVKQGLSTPPFTPQGGQVRIGSRDAPAHLVVCARSGRVRYFDGPLTTYMTQAPGLASPELFSLLKEVLRVPVRDALTQARASGDATTRRLLLEGHEPLVGELIILVEPLSSQLRSTSVLADSDARDELFIVAFYPLAVDATFAAGAGAAHADHQARPVPADRERRELVRSFQREREELQDTIDDLQYVNAELQARNDRLTQSTEDFRSLLDNTLIPTMFLDRELRVGSFTGNMTGLFALRVIDVGRPITDISSRLHYPCLETDVRLVLDTSQLVEREFRRQGEDERVYLMRMRPHRRFGNEIVGVVLAFVDITLRKRAENQVWFLAHHDQLTELPNRVMFRSILDGSMSRPAEPFRSVGMLYLDLDHFKSVNDTFGHRAGDRLLQIVAARLLASMPVDATVCRLGGDEFAICETSGRDLRALEELAAACRDVIARPFEIDGHVVQVGVSIGIAASSRAMDADALTRAADIALYDAKARGRGSQSVFQPGMEVQWQRRRRLETDLREAIASEELSIVYQPIVRLSDRTIIGAEALLRWHHPRHGLLPPADFIAIAEETGLIVPIGAWALETSCAAAAAWPEPLCLAVNLSSMQFAGLDLVDTVGSILTRTGLPPRRLALEMTETVLLHDNRRTHEVLAALRAAGVSIVMDDFGTGYSSLSYIRTFALQKIKIDQTFVQTIDTEPKSKVIVQAIVTIGEGLGIGVCAEGVETQAQLAALLSCGVGEAQGFLLHHPMSSTRLQALLG